MVLAYKEGLGGVNGPPPAVMAVAFVEHIGQARLDLDLSADLGVVDVCVGDVEDARQIAVRIVDDMGFHAAKAAIGLGPIEQFPQRDGGGVDQAQQFLGLGSGRAVGQGCDHRKDIGERFDGPARVGVGEGGTGDLAATEVIVGVGVGVPTGLQRP